MHECTCLVQLLHHLHKSAAISLAHNSTSISRQCGVQNSAASRQTVPVCDFLLYTVYTRPVPSIWRCSCNGVQAKPCARVHGQNHASSRQPSHFYVSPMSYSCLYPSISQTFHLTWQLYSEFAILSSPSEISGFCDHCG